MITSNARTAPPPPFAFEPEVVEAMEKPPLPTVRESVLAPTLCPTCGAPTGARLMVTHIQALVAAYYQIPVRIMTSARGTNEQARARQVAMYLAYELTPKSLPELGRRFGNRDHTTILHGIRCTQRRMLEDAEIEADVKALRERLAA
jgi:chromosomal replication initiation ATPase DnaA